MKKFVKVSSGRRMMIIPEGETPHTIQEQPKPDPAAIRLIEANGCPLGSRGCCAFINSKNVTSVCSALGSYPEHTNGEPIVGPLVCMHLNRKSPIEVRLLITRVDCFVRQGICIGFAGPCDAFQTIVPPPGDNGQQPHYSIVCDRLENPEFNRRR